MAAALAASWLMSRPRPEDPAPPAPKAPDSFRVLGTYPLSADESLRLVHVPDSPTGLRCLIYENDRTKTATLRCDDDLPR